MDEEEKREKKNERETHKDHRKERDQACERVHEHEFLTYLAFLGYFAGFCKKTPRKIIPPIHSSVQRSSWHCGVTLRRGHG